MVQISFDRVSFLFNFVEQYVLKDYQGSRDIVNASLTVQPNENVIDIGGGTGLIAKLLQTKTNQVTVLDPSRKMLQKAKDENLVLLQGDGAALPVRENLFNLAVFINTLHHVPEQKQKKVLQETFRILKPQGRIFIIDLWYPKKILTQLFLFIENLLVGKTHHLRAEEVVMMLKDVGFKDITTFFPKEHDWKYVTIAFKN